MKLPFKSYEVCRVKNKTLHISGKGDSPIWQKAAVLSDFSSPWDNEIPARIEFRALWDDDNLYFLFTVFDGSVHTDTTDDSVESIKNSDRVELFFRKDENINPYYCLEIDAEARIMDFIAYPGRKFDFSWNWPKGFIKVKSHQAKQHFTVEGAISLASLRTLELLKNNRIETGIYRAKFNADEQMHFQPTWITWVDPNTQIPDFHLPASFGMLYLLEE